MRRILSLFATALLGAVIIATPVLTGCKDDPASGNTSSKGTMSAKVGGTAWSASPVTQSTWSNNVLGIGGAQINGGNNKQIIITGLVTAAGEYPIGGFGMQGNYTESSGTSVRTFVATSGTLKVTELTTSGAKGTFSFEAREQILGGGQGTETRSITEGTFDVKF